MKTILEIMESGKITSKEEFNLFVNIGETFTNRYGNICCKIRFRYGYAQIDIIDNFFGDNVKIIKQNIKFFNNNDEQVYYFERIKDVEYADILEMAGYSEDSIFDIMTNDLVVIFYDLQNVKKLNDFIKYLYLYTNISDCECNYIPFVLLEQDCSLDNYQSVTIDNRKFIIVFK